MKYLLVSVLSFLLVCCTDVHQHNDELKNTIISRYNAVKPGYKEVLLALVKETDSLLSEENSPVYKGLNNFIKGAYFTRVSNRDLSIKFLEQVEVDLKGHPEYDSLRFASYIFLSDLQNTRGNYDEAVKKALAAKAGYERLNMQLGASTADLCMARIFQAKGQIEKAKTIIKQNAATQDVKLNLLMLHTLANIYGEQGHLDSALAIDNSVIYEKEKYRGQYLSPFYNNKALCFSEKKMYDSALFYFNASLLADSISGKLQNMSANYNDIGSMYLSQGNLEQAKFYNLKSLDISKRFDKKLTTLSCYKNLYQLAKMSKDYPTAFLYNDSISKLQKELDNVALNTGIEELNLVYETSKKEKKIQEQQSTIAQNKVILGGISFMVLIVAMLIYNFYRKNKLQQELERIELKQSSEKAVADAEQKERQRISRDLHDTSSAYTSALLANIEKLKLKDVKAPELDQMQENANEILSSLRETIWILNNKEVTITDFSDDFKNYCIKVLRNFENIGFDAEEEILNNVMLTAATAIHLKRILQEAVQNSIKHSGATEITYWVKSAEQFEITLSDNGKGFDANAIKAGYGLENMEWRATQAGVRLSRRSLPGKGTIFCIRQL